MFVLDTNVVSELRPGKNQPSQAVRKWASKFPEKQFFLSAVTLLEHEIGIQRLERKTPSQGSGLRLWFDVLRQTFDGRVLPFGSKAAMACAPMHVPDVSDYRDSLIAATAIEHGFTVVTRNTQDFARLKVKLINPWLEPDS